MRCGKCGSENNDSAKFCKKCGSSLKKNINSHEQIINNVHKPKNNNTKIIIVALIIVAVVLAGALIYFYGFNTNPNENIDNVSNDNQVVENVTPENTEVQQAQTVESSEPITTSMTIYGGTFKTGSGLSDKTYASIYVGPEHSGEKIKIQILYSRDGNALNNGNMVLKTVDSSGYINVRSADAYKYYPDFATINIYDTSGNLLDTQSVSLNPDSGTQSF